MADTESKREPHYRATIASTQENAIDSAALCLLREVVRGSRRGSAICSSAALASLRSSIIAARRESLKPMDSARSSFRKARRSISAESLMTLNRHHTGESIFNTPVCRFCLDDMETPKDPLVAPCNCLGSLMP
eukprot:CAMPEP_0115044060 /NCGR_PEP_ID=MMETSP0216-20121206/47238_1 /TAXON_ID=223996 /ORGANISM="Protocruzia adherens, Strain Boccale" /LENGTH=132 /DNA_ID=CAMNT_0002426497 /DNA_START=123 /DNA_END=521 /DNA_ORIENTATION=-